MSENLRIKDRAIGALTKARRAASVIMDDLFEDKVKTAEDARQDELVEARKYTWETPDYRTLSVNLGYQHWMDEHKGADIQPDPDSLYASVATRTAYSPYRYLSVYNNRALEERVNPDLSMEDIHAKSVEYCSKVASRFVSKATQFAEQLADEGGPSRMIAAMQTMVPTYYPEDPERTGDLLLATESRSQADYKLLNGILGVELEEINGVTKEQIMAGVTLYIGIWARLEDFSTEAATYAPTRSHSPDWPLLLHHSFRSLVRDTGWAEYTNVEKLFAEICDEHDQYREGDETDRQRMFFAGFRDPQFFENVLAQLRVE